MRIELEFSIISESSLSLLLTYNCFMLKAKSLTGIEIPLASFDRISPLKESLKRSFPTSKEIGCTCGIHPQQQTSRYLGWGGDGREEVQEGGNIYVYYG